MCSQCEHIVYMYHVTLGPHRSLVMLRFPALVQDYYSTVPVLQSLSNMIVPPLTGLNISQTLPEPN